MIKQLLISTLASTLISTATAGATSTEVSYLHQNIDNDFDGISLELIYDLTDDYKASINLTADAETEELYSYGASLGKEIELPYSVYIEPNIGVLQVKENSDSVLGSIGVQVKADVTDTTYAFIGSNYLRELTSDSNNYDEGFNASVGLGFRF